jgi:hypothetical protein
VSCAAREPSAQSALIRTSSAPRCGRLAFQLSDAW